MLPTLIVGSMDTKPGSSEQTVTIKSAGIEFTATVRDGVALLPKQFQYPVRRKTRAVVTTKKAAPVSLKKLTDSDEYGPARVTARLVGALGSNAVAALLGVSNDRPGRWASGKESPNEENRLQLADLDSLVGHLLSAFTPAQATLWLEGHDPHLGSRPIDVYRLEGAAPVIEAIRAHEQGAFA